MLPMLAKWVVAGGAIVLTACAPLLSPLTVEELRSKAAGKVEFTVEKNYKQAFQTVLARTKACYLGAPTTAQLAVSDSRNYDLKTGNVTIKLLYDATGEEVYLTVDVIGVGEGASKVTAYYERAASKAEANVVQTWLVDGSVECAKRAV